MATVTVPQLKAEAKSLGIVGYSAMRKPELEQAIADKRAQMEETNAEALGQAESDSNKIDNATPSATPAVGLTRAERASQAGKRGVSAQPLTTAERERHYRWQNSTHGNITTLSDKAFTSAQSRRMRQKAHKLSGFNGCTIADYREMRRRMKSAVQG